MSDQDYEKMAKDAVAAAYAKDASCGPAVIATVTASLISRAAQAKADPRPGVVAVVKGAMGGVLLAGQSVPDAAVRLLEALPDITLMMRVGPELLMSWTLEGIAEITPLAGAEATDAIRAKIEERFMGASTPFDQFCVAARARG